MDEATKIIALTECLLIWDRAAETDGDKRAAARVLFGEGKIAKQFYLHGCPFCDYLGVVYAMNHIDCSQCLWPGAGDYRCEQDHKSPYALWRKVLRARGFSPQLARAAGKVFKLLETIDI